MLEHQNASVWTRSGIRDEGEVFGMWGTCWRVGDGLGKWWEARGGASARFPWRERLGLGECVS